MSDHPIRTLPTGEKCHEHPDGTLHLVRDHSHMCNKLQNLAEQHQQAVAAGHDQHQELIGAKQASQAAKGLPAEKSPI